MTNGIESIKNMMKKTIRNMKFAIEEAQNCAQYDTGFIDCSKTSPYFIYPARVPSSMAINKTEIENFISKNFNSS